MKILLKILKGLFVLIILLVIGYFLGPRVDTPNMDVTLPEVPTDLRTLEQMIQDREGANTLVKPDNESRIVWFDSIPKKTDYSIVYLHGWSASIKEGDPLHLEMAKRYGCNLYLPRLAGHGLNEKEAMLDLTADAVIDSAKEAIAIAKQLGDQVIVMATSTGGTLALHLIGNDSDIAGLVLYSPNVAIFDEKASLLAGPWGLQLARLVKGGDYHEFEASALKKRYWTTKYRIEGLTHLQAMIDHTMNKETFEKMKRPAFMGYFYKNDSIQDHVVSVPAMLKMYEELGTPSDQKRKVAFPNVNDHVMASSITSEDLASVRSETIRFLEEIVGLSALR